VVKAIDGGAELEEGRSGKKLLRIRITAGVDGVRSEFEITFGRYGRDNAALGCTYASADAPGGREADAKRFSALIKALTGREPKVYRMMDGKIKIECYEGIWRASCVIQSSQTSSQGGWRRRAAGSPLGRIDPHGGQSHLGDTARNSGATLPTELFSPERLANGLWRLRSADNARHYQQRGYVGDHPRDFVPG
jgi:hypothetical protein